MRVKRYGPVYTFKAWIDERGSNEDSAHRRFCTGRCKHIKLWDLNTQVKGRNIIRTEYRRRPFHLRVLIGPRYRGLGGSRAR